MNAVSKYIVIDIKSMINIFISTNIHIHIVKTKLLLKTIEAAAIIVGSFMTDIHIQLFKTSSVDCSSFKTADVME